MNEKQIESARGLIDYLNQLCIEKGKPPVFSLDHRGEDEYEFKITLPDIGICISSEKLFPPKKDE